MVSEYPSEWPISTLGDDVRIKGRIGWKGYKKEDLRDSGPIVIGGTNVKSRFYLDLSEVKHLSREKYDESPEIVLKHGDVLVVQRGNGIGDSGYFNGGVSEATINPTIIILSDFQGDSRYLFYYLSSPIGRENILSFSSGSSIPAIYQKQLAKLRFKKPSLAIQKKIADVLQTLDDKIELNRQMNATLESMAQALFKSWFVDFDPVMDNALAAGNPIPEELAARAEVRRKALADGSADRGVAEQFPDAFQFSEEMGWIPEGWEVKALDVIADYRNGLALQKFRPIPGESPLPIVKIAQLKNGEATWDEVASPTIASECIIHNGDVVFSWSGSLMIDLWCGGKAALNQHLFKVTSADFPKWFYLSWSNEHLQNFQRIAADKAVTMGHIKRSHLSEAYCAIPNSTLLTKGSEIINPYVEKIIHQRLKNRTLTNLRDTLLPKLISGELRIPNAGQLKVRIDE